MEWMSELNITSLIAYCVFSNLNYYQSLHAKNFNGASATIRGLLDLFAGIGGFGKYIFLIYVGYTTNWYVPAVMGGTAFLIFSPLMMIEVRIPGMKYILSLFSFVGVPVSAFFMIIPYI